jgi:hypothetical protein
VGKGILTIAADMVVAAIEVGVAIVEATEAAIVVRREVAAAIVGRGAIEARGRL